MTANGKRVLVLDDEDVVCKSYERVLTQAGFDVAKAHSGTEALDRVRDGKFDVMLADLRMPGMDGLQVIERLRGTDPEVPVVVITGYPSQATLQEATRLGVTDYLTKPVTPDVLVQATMQAMAAPPWGRSMSTPQATAGAVEERPLAKELPPGTLYWPEQPPAVPAPPAIEEVAKPAVTERTTEPVVAPATKPGGAWRTAVTLALVPVVSLAYVLFLPFLGLVMFTGLAAKALFRKLGGM